MKKNKKFDCVEMKQKGAERINRIISKMSKKEEIEFWNKKTDDLFKKKESILHKLS
jgi:hypothetical protein